MKIKIKNSGYVDCKSSFFSTLDILRDKEFEFSNGINKLFGDIDSGNFAISYLISMYDKVNKNTLFLPHNATVDGIVTPLSDLAKISCYIDESYNLFSHKHLFRNKTVNQLIKCGLKKSKLTYTVTEILDMFEIQSHHRDLLIKETGTERYKIMSAIGFSYGKEVFCFPWFSKCRYEAFSAHIAYSINVLKSLNKTVILPLSKDLQDLNLFN